MIYPNKQFQEKQAQPPPSASPPTRESLELMLSNGLVDVAETMIKKHNLPYKLVEGRLESVLSPGEQHLSSFITVNHLTILMKEDSRKMAVTPYEVLITGETGTGKEIIAKSMIANRKGPIKSVNCAGFPEQLIESELFGHVKGAFTGAETSKEGLFSAATDGVMFLDEISELPLHVQGKLLRALQEKRIRPVGSNVDREINCKFVCATNQSLKEMVEKKLFKKDLYARISTLELDILPLREREEDIIPIVESLPNGKKFAEEYGSELRNGRFDISLNVRSLLQHVIRWTVLGRVTLK